RGARHRARASGREGGGRMMVIDVVGIALVFVVATVVIVAIVVIARSECRTNRELLRVQREWMERMTDDARD
ncbi:MAG: hypothetical protein Q4Q56_09730, partial [Coriobacteriia bacterium]|nr:hypothetical protein [Coriobacteriia bacterium]